MKKIFKYLEWLPFAISLGSLVIYIVYTIQIKMNPAIIITNKLIGTLKAYLIIALVSLFIGLLIILIKKIRKLMNSEQTIVKEYSMPKEDKVIITETKKEDFVKVFDDSYINDEKIVNNTQKYEKTYVKEEQIVTKDIEPEEVKPTYTYKVNGVVCPECNNYISKNAGICPHCGILFDDEIIRVLKKYNKKEIREVKRKKSFSFLANILLTILFIILIILVCNMLYNRYNQNLKNINHIIQRG